MKHVDSRYGIFAPFPTSHRREIHDVFIYSTYCVENACVLTSVKPVCVLFVSRTSGIIFQSESRCNRSLQLSSEGH